jgi:predicted MPP superfamily phosphohydrolase
MQRIRQSIAAIGKNDVQIAVSHLPMTSADVNAARAAAPASKVFSLHRAALILAGGYCSGQWRIPGMGAVYVPDMGFFPADDRIVGLDYLDGVWQHISPGLGASDDYPFMPFRLFNSPGVTMLVLSTSFT